MSAIEIVRVPVADEQSAELARALVAARGGYLAEPRCEALDVFASTEAGEVVAVVHWASRSAHDAAAAEPPAADFFGVVSALAAGPPVVAWYEAAGP